MDIVKEEIEMNENLLKIESMNSKNLNHKKIQMILQAWIVYNQK